MTPLEHRGDCTSTNTRLFIGNQGDVLEGCLKCRAFRLADEAARAKMPAPKPRPLPPIPTCDAHTTRSGEQWPRHKYRARKRRQRTNRPTIIEQDAA